MLMWNICYKRYVPKCKKNSVSASRLQITAAGADDAKLREVAIM